ncbi:MAG: hypothetical protein KGV50_05380 [Gammaproteobacteria bacterium]|nr:hypothetical protein [Gammaproteobacteria bacterium]
MKNKKKQKKSKKKQHLTKGFNSLLIDSSQGGLLVKRENLSTASQRSYGVPDVYVDLKYRCQKCRAKCVFTAQEQKQVYEVKKANINKPRVYCSECYQELIRLITDTQKAEQQWIADKNNLAKDRLFLEHWLGLINKMSAFRTGINYSIKKMLEKKIKQLEVQQETREKQ